ncbi:carboxylic ester hydrolase [Aureococcus anophagefferens]|nr:carboxylic ester hydrolase [Aureococcus anophagefferens]
MLLGGFASIALALASVSPDVLPPNALPPNALPNADASLPAPKALKPCRGESDCISSAGTESPNHFQAPLALAPAAARPRTAAPSAR